MPTSKTISKAHGAKQLRLTVPEVGRTIIERGDRVEWRVVGKKELRLTVLEHDKSVSTQY